MPVLFLGACTGPGADTGFAPGTAIEPVISLEALASNNTKYGEVVKTANGWIVSNDNTDPVEQKILSNGWTVEVKYE